MSLEINLLMVSLSVPGALSPTPCAAFKKHLKVIAVADEWEESSSGFRGADASERRLLKPESVSRVQWLRTIQGVFEPPACTLSTAARC